MTSVSNIERDAALDAATAEYQEVGEAPKAAFIQAGWSSRPTFHLHAWPAQLACRSAGRPECGRDSDVVVAPPPPQATASIWRRAGARLAAAAAAALHGVRPRGGVALASRSRSLEVLSPAGREQSAPYLPSKQQGSAHKQHAASQRQLVVRRWQRAYRAVCDARATLRSIDLLSNRLAPAQDRLHAAIELKVQLAAYPGPVRRQLARTLQAQRRAARLSCKDHIVNELYITGERIFEFFTPPSMGLHRPYVTATLCVVLVLVFFFMAGQYAQYQAVMQPTSTACLVKLHSQGVAIWGPGAMVRWISPRKSLWCYGSLAWKFDAQFLIDWGASFAPLMRSSPQRWLTSALLHQSFTHLLSNTLLLAGLCGQMEIKYGSWRILVVLVLSVFGGNLFSAVTEKPCTAVVGASGAVFGMAGLTIADMVHNFETLRRPLLRTLVLLAFMVFFAVSVATTSSGTSHMSHVGGLLCGLLPGLVLLPNLHRGRWETELMVVAAVGCLAIFTTLPCVFYIQRLPKLCCGC